MNREMRRIQEREERRQKKQDGAVGKANRKAAALSSRSAAPAERVSFFKRIGHYLHEVRQELRKVTWPNREQMVAFTTVTVITSVVLTAVVFGLDIVMKQFVLFLVDNS